MLETDEIRNRIAELYASAGTSANEVPLTIQALELISFAANYVAAAGLLQTAPQHWLPMLQLTGQSVELALKACLAASNVAPSRGHDLLDLYAQAQSRGYALEASKYAAVVHLHHFYYQDLATNTKFKSRYPATQSERLGGAVPPHPTFSAIVSSLAEQANKRLGSNVA